MTSDSSRSFFYDDENQLTRVFWNSGANITDFAYDGLGRMRVRVERQVSGGITNVVSETRYLYDGRRVIQERNGSNTPQVSYTRVRI
jgi:YD repeat-containing protein